MNGEKNDYNDDSDDNDDKENNWNFKINTELPKEKKLERKTRLPKKEFELELDELNLPKRKTRTDMALSLEEEEAEEEARHNLNKSESALAYVFMIKRGVAFIIDLLFIVGMSYVFLEIILDYQHAPIPFFVKFTLSFSLLFFIQVILGAFYNTSLGKKIMGLRVRGLESYTLTISTAFCREMVFKPLSAILLIGFVIPFFSKRHLSLHDMICKTMVVKDE